MNTLFIVRSSPDRFLLELLKDCGDCALVLVLQDAVSYQFAEGIKVYAGRLDVDARGVDRGYEKLDYDEVANLIAESEKVLVW